MANHCTHGNDSYSYATCIRTTDENGVVIQNHTSYSKTTKRHQNEAFRFDGSLHVRFADNVPQGASADDLRRLASSKTVQG